MPKKLLSLLLALVFILSFSGCNNPLSSLTGAPPRQNVDPPLTNDTNSDNDYKDISSINIPFDEDDTLSPYTAKTTVNRYICGLLYDSPLRLTPNYEYEKVLVKEIESTDYVNWTITVPGNITFPDGEKYTAYDLRYSFFRAMSSGSYYESMLSCVGNVVVKDDYTLLVTLLSPDMFFPNLLTFPVIEYGTVEDPVGTGRYTLSDDGSALISTSSDATIKTINLVLMDDPSMLLQETRIGVFDCVFTANPVSVSLASLGGTQPVVLNNLVYLGINSHLGLVNSARFRRALELAIDRDALAQSIYSGSSLPAYTPFNPMFMAFSDAPKRNADVQEANMLLDDMGYTKRDSEGFRTYGYYGSRMTLSLAVNGESSPKVSIANSIKEMLSLIGVDVEINEYSYQNYLAAVENGAHDLYIAETKLTPNMDISPLISPEGALRYGLAQSDALYEQWLYLRSGVGNITDFCETFYSAVPFVPLLYPEGCFVYSRDFYFDVLPTETDIFYNITDWGKK